MLKGVTMATFYNDQYTDQEHEPRAAAIYSDSASHILERRNSDQITVHRSALTSQSSWGDEGSENVIYKKTGG